MSLVNIVTFLSYDNPSISVVERKTLIDINEMLFLFKHTSYYTLTRISVRWKNYEIPNDICVLYSVLLPLFKINNETKDLDVESRTYTMVCSNWMEISKSSEFKIFGASDFYDHKTTENRF